MDSLIFGIIITLIIVIMGLSSYVFKEQILTFQLGIRRKTVIFIDLRQKIRVTLTRDCKTFEYRNKIYIWNQDREKNNACIYDSRNVEPLRIEMSEERCLYWCDSSEYHTNLKNTLLETLMMLKSKDTIITLLSICLLLSVIIAALVYFRTGTLLDQGAHIQQSVEILNQTSRIIEVK